MRAMATVTKRAKGVRPKVQPKAKPKVARPPSKAKGKTTKPRVEIHVDPLLFAPLTDGERADAVRVLLEDERVAEMAKLGRYRVVASEPLVVKPPSPLGGRRLARLVVYDYAGDQCVDAVVDLDSGEVPHLTWSTAQPMLSVEEEGIAVAVARADQRIATQGLAPIGVYHYWSRRQADLAFRRRSAAVVFGRVGDPELVAVVDLVDQVVAEVVPAKEW